MKYLIAIIFLSLAMMLIMDDGMATCQQSMSRDVCFQQINR